MKPRTRRIVITVALAGACVAIPLLAAGSWATGLERAARDGKAQAQVGVASIARRDARAAASEFHSASLSFSRAQAMLGPTWMDRVAEAFPWARRQYTAARTLVEIGLDGSVAGSELAAALLEASSTPSPAASATVGSPLTAGRAHIDAALVALGEVADLASRLQEGGLDPRLAGQVRSVKDALREVAPFLRRSAALLPLERYLLSSQHRLLVVSQDSAELRPTGGFVGSYGILDVGPEGFRLEKYADVYTIPDPPGRVPPPPGADMTKDLRFHDANWWLDFPTSARMMLTLWRGAGQPPVDGVIAIDIVAVRDLLRVLGPVRVPSYSETFTAQNLLERLLYLIEIRSANAPGRKGVLVALASELEQRMANLDPKGLFGSVLALAKSADAKHVQMYFVDAGAQKAVLDMGWSGAIAAAPGMTDLLAVSNAMNQGGKINIAMGKSVAYEVALEADGSAEATLVLGYSNTASSAFPWSDSSTFHDYLRVYRARGSVATPGPASSAKGSTMIVENGLPVVVRRFALPAGSTHAETIVTRVPQAWRAGRGVMTPRSGVSSLAAPAPASPASDRLGHYRLLVVRQADIEDVPTVVTVESPAGWRISSANAWKAASGETLATSTDGRSARLSTPLYGDVILDVEIERL